MNKLVSRFGREWGGSKALSLLYNTAAWKEKYPQKFAPEEEIFEHIHPGDRIFIGTACGEPQHLVNALVRYVESKPDAFFDAEVLHVMTLGVAPYTQEKFKYNFRHNSFFIGSNTREAVNRGTADYTPVFLSNLPRLFYKNILPVDVALVQVSPPDTHGYLSLGISVDIVKAAVESAKIVIAQVNSYMPRVHGDTFIHMQCFDFLVPFDEPLLEYEEKVPDDIAGRIGKYAARIIEDGDTLQVGYGGIPEALLAELNEKKNLGIHTELLSDGVAELMNQGVVDNSRKTINRGKTVAAFCMGRRGTYEFLHDNPALEFKGIDYTNNPLVIAQNKDMVAINSALEIDLTGQATSESLGRTFYSGIGGQADFMRGAVLAEGGKSILTLPSTGRGGKVSRIVPFLREGSGVTLTRGDVHYVITEYGIAYLHGKNIRERAMSLIAIAHPDFRPWLIEEAKKHNLIYKDQAFIPGKRGEYPEHLETYRTTKKELPILLRPVRISDEPLLKEFFYSLSDKSMEKRFLTRRRDMPHYLLQDLFLVIDYTREMVVLAVIENEGMETVVGIGQYGIDEKEHTAEIALIVRDDYQDMGIGSEILSYLIYLAKKQGLLGFTGQVHPENKKIIHMMEKKGFEVDKSFTAGVYLLKMPFKDR